jgi:hypothetical protein
VRIVGAGRVQAVAALAALAAALAACPPGARGDAGGHGPGASAYLARVSGICTVYARELARIGAPSDVTAYGDVLSALGRVVPLLERQQAAMRAIDAPPGLRARLDRLFTLDRRSIAALAAARAAARRRDAGGVGEGLARFTLLSGEVHALAGAMGIRCAAS